MTWDNKKKILLQVVFNLKEKKKIVVEILKRSGVFFQCSFIGRQDGGVSFISLVKTVLFVISD